MYNATPDFEEFLRPFHFQCASPMPPLTSPSPSPSHDLTCVGQALQRRQDATDILHNLGKGQAACGCTDDTCPTSGLWQVDVWQQVEQDGRKHPAAVGKGQTALLE